MPFYLPVIRCHHVCFVRGSAGSMRTSFCFWSLSVRLRSLDFSVLIKNPFFPIFFILCTKSPQNCSLITNGYFHITTSHVYGVSGKGVAAFSILLLDISNVFFYIIPTLVDRVLTATFPALRPVLPVRRCIRANERTLVLQNCPCVTPGRI